MKKVSVHSFLNLSRNMSLKKISKNQPLHRCNHKNPTSQYLLAHRAPTMSFIPHDHNVPHEVHVYIPAHGQIRVHASVQTFHTDHTTCKPIHTSTQKLSNSNPRSDPSRSLEKWIMYSSSRSKHLFTLQSVRVRWFWMNSPTSSSPPRKYERCPHFFRIWKSFFLFFFAFFLRSTRLSLSVK